MQFNELEYHADNFRLMP